MDPITNQSHRRGTFGSAPLKSTNDSDEDPQKVLSYRVSLARSSQAALEKQQSARAASEEDRKAQAAVDKKSLHELAAERKRIRERIALRNLLEGWDAEEAKKLEHGGRDF